MVLSSQIIKELRDKSGAGMLDCNKALEESNGDIDKAIEWLRKIRYKNTKKKNRQNKRTNIQVIKF